MPLSRKEQAKETIDYETASCAERTVAGLLDMGVLAIGTYASFQINPALTEFVKGLNTPLPDGVVSPLIFLASIYSTFTVVNFVHKKTERVFDALGRAIYFFLRGRFW